MLAEGLTASTLHNLPQNLEFQTIRCRRRAEAAHH